MVSFILNGQIHSVNHVLPETTVLDYLRETLGRTGTKEGCASGDCGACTVVIAGAQEKTLKYRTSNACITLLGTLHGKQLITVENLSSDKTLHQCQQAIVNCHGSQCGFCTPGFVMSLFSHFKNYSSPDRDQLIESLGGNLCRCTGYKPILNAGVSMYENGSADKFDKNESDTIRMLKGLPKEDPNLILDTRKFCTPKSLDELADILLDQPNARLLAGGTDLGLEITQELAQPKLIVYTGSIEAMTCIEDRDHTFHIGGAATYTDVSPLLVSRWPTLGELFNRLGSVQIRNQGTIGGNVANASPIADTLPPLLALDATLTLRKGSRRRVLALKDFFIHYKVTALEKSEFIESIQIPKGDGSEYFVVYKVSKRMEDDISAVCLALRWRLYDNSLRDVRIAYGGLAEIPKRSIAAEKALEGNDFKESSIRDAMSAVSQEFSPIDDVRASAKYREKLAKNLLFRAYLAATQNKSNLRVTDYCA